jgi:hypothetical protein
VSERERRERRERRESDKERDSERDRGPCDRGIIMLFQHHQFCAEKPFLAPPRPPGASLWSSLLSKIRNTPITYRRDSMQVLCSVVNIDHPSTHSKNKDISP